MKLGLQKGSELDRSVVIRFVVPYFIILILAVAVGLFIYQRTSGVIEQEVEHSNQILLEQGMNVMDNRWKGIDTFASSISDDSSVIGLELVSDPFDSNNLYRVIETRNQLKENHSASDLILDYFLLFKKSGLVLNGDLISDIRNLPQSFNYSGASPDFFTKLMNEYHDSHALPANVVSFNGKQYSVISYLQSFGFSNYSNASILVLIDNKEVTKLFNGLNIAGGWAYIANKQGDIVTSVTGAESEIPLQKLTLQQASGVMKTKIAGKPMLITYVSSPYNGWTYVAAQPFDVVLKRISYIRNTTFIVFFFFLFIGAVMSLFFAYRNSKPMRAIIQTLAAYPTDRTTALKDPYGMIKQKILQIIDSNSELRSKMEDQLPLLQAAFFERLLKGQFYSQGEAETVMQYVRVRLEQRWFVVALLSFPGIGGPLSHDKLEHYNLNKIVLKEFVRKHFPDNLHVHDVDQDKLALLFALDHREKERCYESAGHMMQTLQQQLHQQLQMITLLSVGNAYDNILEIAKSFSEARQAHIRSRDNRIVWFKEIEWSGSVYYFPENIEYRLTSAIQSGNEGSVLAVMEELYRHNFVERSPLFVLKVFLYHLLGTAMKISAAMGDTGALEESLATNDVLNSIESIEECFRAIKDALLAMSRSMAKQNHDKQLKRFQDIVDFIDEHFSDGNLSLTFLADRFEVSETYLSRLFKERTGINFFDYLEHRRIARSKQLLEQTDIPIGEIALSVGYSSLNTFGRAFKRKVGTSAMDFRKMGKPAK